MEVGGSSLCKKLAWQETERYACPICDTYTLRLDHQSVLMYIIIGYRGTRTRPTYREIRKLIQQLNISRQAEDCADSNWHQRLTRLEKIRAWRKYAICWSGKKTQGDVLSLGIQTLNVFCDVGVQRILNCNLCQLKWEKFQFESKNHRAAVSWTIGHN